ncbi:cell division protein SepF [Fuchsiella alkaliacetigena]|uniref:cell division protein SepF n=1 Tax=Fuchsiella alkaliacetigena TaxID=957042 RepID=UPI00200A400D|nr:cell division protein SepF [Fuchsiella alkaliacetigena]MCK8823700.1 cell division protein SepF [Fuchsiella alkaliacetigena]
MKEKILQQIADFLGFKELYEEDCVNAVNDKSLQGQEQNKVVKLHSYAEKELFVVKPNKFEDAATIADKLKEQQPVILDLQETDVPLAAKIIDFISGASYALDGHREKLSDKIFLFTPQNLKINNQEQSIKEKLDLKFLTD